MDRFLWAVTVLLFICAVWTAIVELGELIFCDYSIYLIEDLANAAGSFFAATYFGLVLLELGR